MDVTCLPSGMGRMDDPNSLGFPSRPGFTSSERQYSTLGHIIDPSAVWRLYTNLGNGQLPTSDPPWHHHCAVSHAAQGDAVGNLGSVASVACDTRWAGSEMGMGDNREPSLAWGVCYLDSTMGMEQ